MMIIGAALVCSRPQLIAQQEVACSSGQTIEECHRLHLPSGGVPRSTAEQNVGAAMREVGSDLQAKSTGTDLSAEGPLTAIRDFLPRLAGTLLSPALGGNLQSLGLKANLPFNEGPLFDIGMIAQFAAVANEAKAYGPLIEAFPEGSRNGARGRLEQEIQQFDDLTFSGSLNVESRAFGRSLASHRDDLARIVSDVLSGRELRAEMIRREEEHRALRRTLHQELTTEPARILAPTRPPGLACAYQQEGGPREAGEMPIGCFDAATRSRIEASIATLAETRSGYLRDASQRIRASGVLRLAQLVNNQPQLNGTLQYRHRADLVGPSEWTGTARFEMGFANMNALRRHCGAAGVGEACLRRFTENPQVRRTLDRGDRVWSQIDFTRREPWRVALPADTVEMALGSALGIGVSAGYGAYVGRGEEGRNRFDLQGKYDFTRDDPIRQNRFVATLLYTLRLSDQSSALLGLTYANRPEFVGNVDRRLGANLGLTYKVNRGTSAAPATTQ